jgi:ABC-type glycerol-3-phosphate transport system substrate-binding protein
MKKLVSAVALAAAFLLVVSGCSKKGAAKAEDPTKLSGTITVWSSGDELGRFVEGFNKIYPNIKVDITVIPNADFLAKLQPALSAGQGAPDVFTGESDYVKYLVNNDVWEDLRAKPYDVGRYADNIWKYVVSVGTDSSGAIRALSWQASPGSVIYRRDIAKKYLGTDDPAQIGAMLGSNAKMLEVAKKLSVGSKGKVKMFASWQDIFNMQFSNRASGWVKDKKLVIDDSMLDFFDVAKTITTEHYDLNTDPWSPAWMAAVEGDETFCYVLPTWGYQAVVKPAAKKTSGQWGLAEGPVPYVKGGTWVGISKKSDKKDLAWKFVEYATCNAAGQKEYSQKYGEYVSTISADKELASGSGEEVLGGQNLYAFYNSLMEKIPDDRMTEYDQQINSAYLGAVKAYAAGKLSKDAAIGQFKADVRTAYAELSVE